MEGIINMIKKNWYYAAAVMLLIIVVLVILRRRKDDIGKNNTGKDVTGKNSAGSGSQNTNPSGVLKAATYPLQPYELVGVYSAEMGSVGAQIKVLQQLVNKTGKYSKKLDEDGRYGPETLKGFKAVLYQTMASNGTINEAQYNKIVKDFNK